ncbi:InlB B-repeat-containing protein [Fibrobacter sp.]|uniref:InlB B-repeat-containing protein n=1 Tax=Fibrobacter sp. TaxID=35828 RepID=UPI0025C66CA9|nr:InlB B-repeat-containing protein [Fibrobacter sp.]MBR3072738.1 InlB B-repeat-containing protein [Fibrobacter sp.]
MKKNICCGLGMALAFAAVAHAQDTYYKVTKVGSEEHQSFNILLNNETVTEAKKGDWLYVSPIVPDGKMFKGYTLYDKYGDKSEDQVVSTTEKKELQFLMPDHEVYVKASYESLRYYINAIKTEHGSVSYSFSDRMDIRDRTKPTFKVTVTPRADEGYKLASIKVSRYLDAATTVTCAKTEAAPAGPGATPGASDGSCVFEMPYFDVDITAKFVADSVDLPIVDLKDSKFKLTYKLDGGKLPKDAAKSFACSEIAKLPTPTKEGFDFVGWSFENKLSNTYYALDRLDGTLCSDTTLYAIWTAAGTCMEQTAIAIEGDAKSPVCSSNIRCALIHSNKANQDSVCNGVVWISDTSILPSSSSVASSSSVTSSSSIASSSSEKASSSSSVVESSSSEVVVESSSATQSSSSEKQASSSSDVASSSSETPASSSAKEKSSSSEIPASSSETTSSSSEKPVSSSSKTESSSSSATQTKYYKITKVGSEENQSFTLVLNGSAVTEAKQGDWPEISPIVPEGKKYKSFTLYDEYGDTPEEQKERTTGKLGMRFLMPDHQVYVKVTYELDVASSSSTVESSSASKPTSSSAKVESSSSAKPASSSTKVESSSAAKPASSSVKAESSSAAKPASSSAKAKSSSGKSEASSSSKAKSSSSVESVVESVKTEEDLPNCTEKREGVTYYVSDLKKLFICKDKKWTKFDPNGLPMIARAAKFSAVVNGRQLQVSGAKVGSQVNLLDLQGRVVYSGKADAANFTMNLVRSGTFVLRIGTQQKVVNIR